MDVAQVEVRLGETTLEVAFVHRGEDYWIGTRAGVDLPVASIGAFPLISDGLTVRAPIGMALVVNGHATTATELRLAAGAVIELAFGLVVVEIRRVVIPPAPIPRALPDRRLAGYVAASLLAHLCMWAVAISLAHAPHVKRPRPQLIGLVGHIKAAREAAPIAPPAQSHVATAHADVQVAHPEVAMQREAALGTEPIAALVAGPDVSELVAALDRADVVGALSKVGPVYHPEDAPSFGGQRTFDPTQRADFASIPTGAYATISTGRAAGDGYELPGWRPPPVALCATARCQIDGELTGAQMRDALLPHIGELAACASAHHGEVVLDLDIDAAGKVHAIRGHGLGAVARCAAAIVASVEFPAADAATHASYPIGY